MSHYVLDISFFTSNLNDSYQTVKELMPMANVIGWSFISISNCHFHIMEILEVYAQFTTITALNWKPVLMESQHKDLIINSLRFLVENKRIYQYAFVVMDNHLHVIWQTRPPYTLPQVQRDFLKFTSQHLKHSLLTNDPEFLTAFEVNLADRKYQVWQRDSLSIPLYSPVVFDQKINYIHQNPVKAGLADTPWEYYYSSASFYYTGKSDFDFLSHFEGD